MNPCHDYYDSFIKNADIGVIILMQKILNMCQILIHLC